MNFLFVGLGGAIGACLRYAISLLPSRSAFPIWTLITNIIGAFAIGIIAGIAVRKNLPANAVLFLKTGLCGGFTTFSTFSLESYNLIQSDRIGLAILYMILSFVLCLIGVMSGMLISEKV